MNNALYDVYISIEAFDAVIRHAHRNKDLEVIGFLVGNVYTWLDRYYTVVTKSQPVRSVSSEYRVVPKEGSLAEVVSKIGKLLRESIIVGWYHTHPNFGCFLSSVDIETQKNLFSEPYHVAIVVDPVRKLFDVFKLSVESYERASFVIFKVKKT